MDWDLYVDESGDFADATQGVVVAGLLVPAGALGFAPKRIEEALRRAAPHVPWPIHASYIRLPAAHVLWQVAAAGARPDGLSSFAIDAARHLADAAPEAWARALRLALGKAGPKYDDVAALDTVLHGAIVLYRHWDGVVRSTVARIHEVLEAALASPSPHPAVLIVAGETRPGDANAPHEDRYLNVLAALLERVAHAVATQGGAHAVRLHVLERDLRDPVLGRVVRLTSQRVGAAAARFLGPARTHSHAGGTVRLVPHEVERWTDALSAPFVVADWLANRSRGPCQSNTPLASLLQHLADATALPAAIGGHPTVTAFGLAREFIASARAGEPTAHHPLLVTRGLSRWVREQAQHWGAYYA